MNSRVNLPNPPLLIDRQGNAFDSKQPVRQSKKGRTFPLKAKLLFLRFSMCLFASYQGQGNGGHYLVPDIVKGFAVFLLIRAAAAKLVL